MSTIDPPPAEPPTEQVETSPQTRRDVIIAGAILGLVIGALTCYFAVSRIGSSAGDARQEISAAAWVGGGAADSGADHEAVAQAEGQPETAVVHYAPTKEELEAPALGPETAVEVDAAAGPLVKQGTVVKGMPVIKSLTRLGLSGADAHAIIAALDGIFDFRRARPGQSFEVRLDSTTGRPRYFRYDVSITEVYEVRLKGERLVGKKKNIPTKKKLRRYGGTIASSLYKALGALSAHPSLSGRIVEVLANEVDFYKAQRPGDTFRVIVEEESLDGQFIGYGPVEALEYNGVKSGKKRFFRFAAGDETPTYYSQKGISVPRSVISIPLHYTRLSSPFGKRYHPILKRKKLHNGVDFAAPYGTPVWACQAGRVTCASRKGANGNLVGIQHAESLQSFYAHLQRFAAGIKPGAQVRERQVIGYVGSTGRSTGPHLHFGLKKGGRFIDPLKYKVRPGRPAPPRYRAKLKALIAEQGRLLDQTRIRPPAAPLSAEPDEDEILGLEDL